MLEDIRLSFQGIWNHKLRSLLTMLGIIIGIASIISIVSTIKGTNEQIKKNLIGSGSNVVTVTLQQDDGYGYYDPAYSAPPEGMVMITEEIRQEIISDDKIVGAALYRQREWSDNVYYKNTGFNGSVIGADVNYFDVTGYSVIAGRPILEDDVRNSRKVVFVEEDAAAKLFNGDPPLGKTLEINGEPFTVAGILTHKSDFTPTINNISDYEMYGQSRTGSVFIPESCWSVVYRYDEPYSLAIKAKTTDDMTSAGKRAADILNKKLVSGDIKYAANDLTEQASQLQELASATNRQLIWIAGISLLVGGIGVMNIMMVTVTERTKEIGLKKAIGARRSRILRQFLTEAAVLTCMGGILGVLAGLGLAKLMSFVSDTPWAVSVPSCIVAVVFSAVIGLVFGLAPAVKASKLNPIEALNRE